MNIKINDYISGNEIKEIISIYNPFKKKISIKIDDYYDVEKKVLTTKYTVTYPDEESTRINNLPVLTPSQISKYEKMFPSDMDFRGKNVYFDFK